MVSLMLRACRDELIYLAGPLFSEAERRFNLELTHRLEVIGFDVSLQQRVERHRPPYDTMTPEERRHAMFRLDQDPRRRCVRARRACPRRGSVRKELGIA